MRARLNFGAMTVAFFVALVVSYFLCITGDLLFGWRMYEVWMPLLPGFTWPLTLGGLSIGLAWLVGYSVYGALLLVIPYNILIGRRAASAPEAR